MKIVAYCRVSTEKEAQIDSLEYIRWVCSGRNFFHSEK